jgi:hypothetical protein
MSEESILQYITCTYDDLETFSANGDTFIFYDPEHKFPMATLVTSDYNDTFSDLNRPGVFRLNIGVGKETFQLLFGAKPSLPSWSDPPEAYDGPFDFTVLDTVLPHPVYGRQYWVSVLNPSDETFENQVKPLLAEAYEISERKYAKRKTRA